MSEEVSGALPSLISLQVSVDVKPYLLLLLLNEKGGAKSICTLPVNHFFVQFLSFANLVGGHLSVRASLWHASKPNKTSVMKTAVLFWLTCL